MGNQKEIPIKEMTSKGSVNIWITTLSCNRNVMKFIQWINQCIYLVKEGWLLVDLSELRAIKKKKVSFLMVDRKTKLSSPQNKITVMFGGQGLTNCRRHILLPICESCLA